MNTKKRTVFDCPSCGEMKLRPHCRTCRWRVCGRCQSYGIPGGRWYNKMIGRAE